MMKDDIIFNILYHKLIAIIRKVDGEDALKVAQALLESKIPVIEIAVSNFQSYDTIKLLNDKLGHEIILGAGTILNIETAEKAIQAGAKFLLSPGFDVEVMNYAKEQKVLFIPGAYSPSEILAAQKCGAKLIKFFPAGGQESYFKNLQGPMSHIPLMPVGNIHAGNIKTFYDAGARAFGIGSSLVKSGIKWDEAAITALKQKAAEYVSLLSSLKQ